MRFKDPAGDGIDGTILQRSEELTVLTDAFDPLHLSGSLKRLQRGHIYEDGALVYMMEAVAVNMKPRIVMAMGRGASLNRFGRLEI